MAEYFAFYGTLRRDAADPDAPSRAGLVAYRGPCLLSGTLRDHGAYPGLFKGNEVAPSRSGPVVKGDLFEILRPEAFAVFDHWEHYRPHDEEGSLYLRRRVRLIEPDCTAWVYLSQITRDDPHVPSGDWLEHISVRA